MKALKLARKKAPRRRQSWRTRESIFATFCYFCLLFLWDFLPIPPQTTFNLFTKLGIQICQPYRTLHQKIMQMNCIFSKFNLSAFGIHLKFHLFVIFFTFRLGKSFVHTTKCVCPNCQKIFVQIENFHEKSFYLGRRGAECSSALGTFQLGQLFVQQVISWTGTGYN